MKNGNTTFSQLCFVAYNNVDNVTQRSDGYLNAVELTSGFQQEDGFQAVLDFLATDRAKRHLEAHAATGSSHELVSVSWTASEIWIHPCLSRSFALLLIPSISTEISALLGSDQEEAGNSFGSRFISGLVSVPVAPRKEKSPRLVYLIGSQCKTFLKIGISRNVSKRLATLNSNNPLRLNILFALEGNWALEQKLLKEFSHLKASGEWLTWDNKVIERFAKLSKDQLQLWGSK